MITGFKMVNDFLWPESDVDCAAVVFDRVVDLELAKLHCNHYNAVIQAGGNAGVWPKWLGKRFKTVYTFEPEPSNFYCLAHNCPEQNIIKIQAALGFERKLVGIGLEEGFRNMGACNVNGSGVIPIIRIDDLMLEQCDLIQLDIEGYEFEALRGADRTLRRCRPILMLEDKGLSEKYGTEKGWIEKYVQSYEYYVVDRVERDIIFAPKESA